MGYYSANDHGENAFVSGFVSGSGLATAKSLEFFCVLFSSAPHRTTDRTIEISSITSYVGVLYDGGFFYESANGTLTVRGAHLRSAYGTLTLRVAHLRDACCVVSPRQQKRSGQRESSIFCVGTSRNQ